MRPRNSRARPSQPRSRRKSRPSPRAGLPEPLPEGDFMNEPTRIVYASARRRTAALLIDLVILAFAMMILQRCIADIRAQQAVSQLMTAIYFIFLESSARMGSFGKSFMKINVATVDGSRISIAKAALRYLIFAAPGLLF